MVLEGPFSPCIVFFFHFFERVNIISAPQPLFCVSIGISFFFSLAFELPSFSVVSIRSFLKTYVKNGLELSNKPIKNTKKKKKSPLHCPFPYRLIANEFDRSPKWILSSHQMLKTFQGHKNSSTAQTENILRMTKHSEASELNSHRNNAPFNPERKSHSNKRP